MYFCKCENALRRIRSVRAFVCRACWKIYEINNGKMHLLTDDELTINQKKYIETEINKRVIAKKKQAKKHAAIRKRNKERYETIKAKKQKRWEKNEKRRLDRIEKRRKEREERKGL